MVSPLSDPHFLERIIAQQRVVEWSVQGLPICQLARRQLPETPLQAHQRMQWSKIRNDYYGRQTATP